MSRAVDAIAQALMRRGLRPRAARRLVRRLVGPAAEARIAKIFDMDPGEIAAAIADPAAVDRWATHDAQADAARQEQDDATRESQPSALSRLGESARREGIFPAGEAVPHPAGRRAMGEAPIRRRGMAGADGAELLGEGVRAKTGLTETEIPEARCVGCGTRINAVSSHLGKVPSPGAVTVCIECSTVMVLDEQLIPREPTDEEIVAMAGHPMLRRYVEATGAVREEMARKRRGGGLTKANAG